MSEGPKVKIRRLEFTGNSEVSDRRLARRMKDNRARSFFSFLTGRGVYQETKFEEDAERVLDYYRDHGYIRAQVGEPQVRTLEDSDDKKTRWVELRIPINEGNRYRVDSFKVAGNTVVKSEALTPLFKLQQGKYYNQKMMAGWQAAKILKLAELRAARTIAKALRSSPVLQRAQNKRRARNFIREELGLYRRPNNSTIRPSNVKARRIIS